MDARGRDRPTESNRSLNHMTSKRIKEFEIAECEEVRSSISLAQRYERHKNKMKGCAAELKVSEWQMIASLAWTSWSCDTVKGRRGMADDRYVML